MIWSLISAESIKGVYIKESICSSDFTVCDEDTCCYCACPLTAGMLPATWFWFYPTWWVDYSMFFMYSLTFLLPIYISIISVFHIWNNNLFADFWRFYNCFLWRYRCIWNWKNTNLRCAENEITEKRIFSFSFKGFKTFRLLLHDVHALVDRREYHWFKRSYFEIFIAVNFVQNVKCNYSLAFCQ